MNRRDTFARISSKFTKCFLLMALVLAWLAPPGLAQAAARYRVTSLGTIGSNGSLAYDLNEVTDVVGRLTDASGGTNGFYWNRQDGMSQLGSLGGNTRAWGINNFGQIAGVSNNLAVLWSNAAAAPQSLGTLGGPTSYAYRIFDYYSRVVGWADKPTIATDPPLTAYHAFISDNGGPMTDLGTLASDQSEYNYYGGYSLSYYANSAGQVVGIAHTDGWLFHAFVWDQTNGMTDLGTNPNDGTFEGYATAINQAGTLIAGCTHDPQNGDISYLLLWPNGSTSPVIIPTPAAYPYGEFYDLNEAGQVVGLMWDSLNNEHALIYDAANGLQDLNDFIPADSGWVLNMARSINARGQIVGSGTLNGDPRAFLLTPVTFNPALPMLLLD